MKKFWKKYKVVVIVIIAIGAFIGLSFLTQANSNRMVSIKKWEKAVQKDEYVVTFVGTSSCDDCDQYEPSIQEVAGRYEIPLYSYNVDKLNENDAKALEKTLNLSNYDNTAPHIVITKNGEVISQKAGIMDEAEVSAFLRGMLSGISESINNWAAAVEKDEYVVTVIGLTYCTYCQTYEPIIEELTENNNIPLYWHDIDELSEVDAQILSKSFGFTEYTGSSPYTAVTKKGKVIAQKVGAMGESSTREFLKDSGAIK